MTCNFCQKKGHKEDACWKKNKSKAPQWLQDKWAKQGGGGEASNVEVVVVSVEAENHELAKSSIEAEREAISFGKKIENSVKTRLTLAGFAQKGPIHREVGLGDLKVCHEACANSDLNVKVADISDFYMAQDFQKARRCDSSVCEQRI